ncbi:MAG: toprim domain-containing protein [Marinobacter sp.]|nr:toprim domain-containing protein [Marinobacter sp.]
MKQPTRDVAKGKWHHILPEFGIEPRHLVNKHGPCPACGGNDRFRFDNKEGTGSYICGQCGSGDGFKLIEMVTGQPFSDIAKRIDEICQNTDIQPEKPKRRKDPRNALRNVGKRLQRVGHHDPVADYLRGRGISGITGYALRLHPALGYYERDSFNEPRLIGQFPAMVAKIENAQGKTESFHITYLTKDGQKADVSSAKKILTPVNSINGCAIRLAPMAEHIAVTEGIENALAVMEGEGLPCWACVSAHGIETFEPPEGIKQVTIFADNDASFTGQAAAYALAKRLHRNGLAVEVYVSGQIGDDYLDCLIRSRRAAA